MTRRILIIALYVAFALVVYVAHGPRPDINIDHIAYFKLANDIRASHPNHDYWQGLSATRTYGVLMAYLFDSTGDHIRSLKFMLAVMHSEMYTHKFVIWIRLGSTTMYLQIWTMTCGLVRLRSATMHHSGFRGTGVAGCHMVQVA